MLKVEMKLDSSFVGTTIKPFYRDVHWRDCMNYAAAVNDSNPCYFDDERPGGIIAPPMFGVAVTWPVIERLPDLIDADDFPTDLFATMVHYTEHLSFHRPVKPGQQLTVSGRIVAILPHRAGTRVVIRFHVTDQDGVPVFTEHVGAMLRGVQCLDAGRGEDNLPAVPSQKASSDAVWEVPLFIDPLRPFVYDGCTGIVFPIHTSNACAKMVGLPGIILQGTATLALAVRELIDREGGGDPLKLSELACRFTGFVRPGSEIRITLDAIRREKESTGLFFNVSDAHGRPSIRDGYLAIKETTG